MKKKFNPAFNSLVKTPLLKAEYFSDGVVAVKVDKIWLDGPMMFSRAEIKQLQNWVTSVGVEMDRRKEKKAK